MGSIAKAMKDALEATGYSKLRDYQRKKVEVYLSGGMFLCLLQEELARV